MGKMTVYHGSSVIVENPQIITGKYTKDFGSGFYCTMIREQAERWARRYDTPTVNIYTVRMDTRLKILEFREMTEEWLDFIIDCRHGVSHDYDIVIGAMANDQIYNYIADYMDGILTRDQFWTLARFKYPTHQINFCTNESLKCLKPKMSEICIRREGADMTGRENKKDNDLFFTCSLIEYIARKTKNKRSVVVDALGKTSIEKIYDLADIYHSDNIETVSDYFIEKSGLLNGTFDNISAARYAVPSHWDIGKVYKRLILGIANEKGLPVINALFAAYHSFVSDKIDDYNSSFYYDAPQNILSAFLDGEIE